LRRGARSRLRRNDRAFPRRARGGDTRARGVVRTLRREDASYGARLTARSLRREGAVTPSALEHAARAARVGEPAQSGTFSDPRRRPLLTWRSSPRVARLVSSRA